MFFGVTAIRLPHTAFRAWPARPCPQPTVPFPLGLARVSARLPELVPWAWGVSGCFSVISAILATILAIHFGFTVVVVIAAVLYLAAGMIFRAPLAGGQSAALFERASSDYI